MAREWKLDEFWEAKVYLEKKIKAGNGYLEHIENWEEEERAKEELFKKVQNVTMLQEWINKYLTQDQIKKLRVYLRVTKSRKNKEQKNITITPEAHYKLSEYAKRNNVTLSEAINKLCGNVVDLSK